MAAMAILATGCVHYYGPAPEPAIEHEEYEPMPGPDQPVQVLISPKLENLREFEQATNAFYEKALDFTWDFNELLFKEMEYNYDVNHMTQSEIVSAFRHEAIKAKWYFYRELDTTLYYEFGKNYQQFLDVETTLDMWWVWYAETLNEILSYQ